MKFARIIFVLFLAVCCMATATDVNAKFDKRGCVKKCKSKYKGKKKTDELKECKKGCKSRTKKGKKKTARKAEKAEDAGLTVMTPEEEEEVGRG